MDVPVEIENTELAPIPVRIVSDSTVQEEAATVGVFRTIVFAGTEQPVQLLQQDRKRKSATIIVNPGAAGNTQGYVIIGARQVPNNQGGQLYSGNSITISSQNEFWIVPDGTHSLTVTILDERN